MALDLVFPHTVGNAFGPDFRLLNGFLLAADPLGRLLAWFRSFVVATSGGLELGPLVRLSDGRVVPATVGPVRPGRASQCLMSTGVPSGTRRQISSISTSVTAMQPAVQSSVSGRASPTKPKPLRCP